ncbi:MAG: hypothetical protein Q8P41_31675 [Pseudomonadota bacterium]|nr:hypothetical protein [Pseudomonadota bacterium]
MDAPALCPKHGTPFCYECTEDVADVSMLRREVVGPHPITGQVFVRWVHRDGCPDEKKE